MSLADWFNFGHHCRMTAAGQCHKGINNITQKEMRLLIKNGKIVNEGHTREAWIAVEDGVITHIFDPKDGATSQDNDAPRSGGFDKEIDATGCFVLPGVIDEHVHFRDPGLTQKADIESESRAAAFGGVTSYFDMPNTVPQTTTIAALEAKKQTAKERSHVNYGFFIGATNDNIEELKAVDPHAVPGIKLFMGASTGNMLVDKEAALRRIFAETSLPVMTHCEDTAMINARMADAKASYGPDPDVTHHAEIRCADACYASTRLAVDLARTYGTRLHVAHLTTARELELFGSDPQITAEAVIAHLMFTDTDYATLGTKIKCNPAVKSLSDREALRRALADGRITTVGTDHAPHQWTDKQGGCAKAASGMPMIQFSLVSMLQLVDEGVITIERLVELMCHAPARLFDVRSRGYLRPGYKADITIVKRGEPWAVTRECIQSKCKWSPMEGHTFNWTVKQTICNGQVIYDNGTFDASSRGEEIMFR